MPSMHIQRPQLLVFSIPSRALAQPLSKTDEIPSRLMSKLAASPPSPVLLAYQGGLSSAVTAILLQI